MGIKMVLAGHTSCKVYSGFHVRPIRAANHKGNWSLKNCPYGSPRATLIRWMNVTWGEIRKCQWEMISDPYMHHSGSLKLRSFEGFWSHIEL